LFLFLLRGFTGDGAIDEIRLLPGRKCPPIDERDDIIAHYCDFEDESICNYYTQNSWSKAWIRSLPFASDPISYPKGDNTLQTLQGHFMLFEVSFVEPLFAIPRHHSCSHSCVTISIEAATKRSSNSDNTDLPIEFNGVLSSVFPIHDVGIRRIECNRQAGHATI
jgi:hypothetical protein